MRSLQRGGTEVHPLIYSVEGANPSGNGLLEMVLCTAFYTHPNNGHLSKHSDVVRTSN